MALAPAFTCTAPAPDRAVSSSMACHTSDDMKGCCCASPDGSPSKPTGGCSGWCEMQSDRAHGASGPVFQTAPALDGSIVAQLGTTSLIPSLVNASPPQLHPPSLALTPLRI
jgi:hypothetical protein